MRVVPTGDSNETLLMNHIFLFFFFTQEANSLIHSPQGIEILVAAATDRQRIKYDQDLFEEICL